MIRRMNWRNERSLYKRKCGLTGKNIVSCFSEDSGITVYNNKDWFSDKWNPMDYGRNYDFNKPFFKQFRELLTKVPMPATFIDAQSVNSEYCNHAESMKNCYLSFGALDDEEVNYCDKVSASKEVYDSLVAAKSELAYQLISADKIYQSAFLRKCINCNHSYFLFECRNCSNCIACTNLRNKSYCIFNKQYSKEEYEKKKRELKLNTYSGIQKVQQKFENLKLRSIHRFATLINATDSTGDNLHNVKNCQVCFDVLDAEDNKYVIHGGFKMTDSYDGYGLGGGAELIYEAVDTGLSARKLFFDIVVWYSNEVEYSYNCKNCFNCFACIGLRNKQYCILNKQYSKEEYFPMVEKIKKHMNEMPYIDKQGRVYKYGEFFPPELSPFAYNETIAQEYFPLTKEEAIKKGYRWKDREKRNYQITLKTKDIPDNIKDVDNSILKEVIECATNNEEEKAKNNCSEAFKIIPPELEFYKKMNLPLPRYCPNCRHHQRLKNRNPLKLYKRTCMKEGCNNTFETTYAPDRPEIVYCEECYNREVN